MNIAPLLATDGQEEIDVPSFVRPSFINLRIAVNTIDISIY